MKKSKLVLLILFMAFILVACAPAAAVNDGTVAAGGPPVTSGTPTHFVCYQGGKSIIDSHTLNGVSLERVTYRGGWSVLSWVWDDEMGHQTLDKDGSLCGETK